MDLIARVVTVFETPMGMAVLGMAAIAFAALFILVFWDSLRMPRRDRVEELGLDTAPPKLLDPSLITRSPEGSFDGPGPPWLRNLVLVGLGLLFVMGAFQLAGHLASGAKMAAAVPPARLEARLPEGAARLASNGHSGAGHVSLCREEGDLSNLTVSTCARGASVRFDLLKLKVGGRYVVRPAWASAKAPTFVTSDSHAAPFTLSQEVTFAAPETTGEGRYDGYLVIGVGDSGQAALREEALRRLALAKLSGGDRAQCESQERIYSVTARFNAARASELERAEAEVARLEKAAAKDAKARADLTAAEERLADLRLLVTSEPAPIVLGIAADPLSADQGQDMRAAAEAFLVRHAEELQLSATSPVRMIRACTRGAPTL